jgi:putative membrane protein
MLALFANDPVYPWHPTTFVEALLSAAAFGGVGIILLMLGFVAFELVTRRLDVQKELADKNIAVGIAVAGLLISIALIVIRAIGG